jgi:chemotaxis protein methyltransferase CheR
VLRRNVLIYFAPETAAAVLYRLVGALAPGGILVLGPVELPLARALELEWVEDRGATLLRRQ